MLDEIKRIIIEQLDVEEYEISEDSLFIEDLGADSLDIIELLEEIKEQFNVSIEQDEVKNIKRVKDLIEYINKHKE